MSKIVLNTYTFRLFSFWGVVIFISGFGTFIYYEFLTFRQFDWIDSLLLLTFSILFLHLSYGASIALFGFIQFLFGGDNLRCQLDARELDPISLENTSIAIVIPIYNEVPAEVYERISKMYLDLQTHKEFKSFDFFIMSDTNKIPIWLKEETEFISLMKKTQGWGHIFYRRRKSNTNGKSGNISDFCRRYGRNYRYMIILDADSYMEANGMILLAKKMESETSLGILQTNPLIYKANTIFQKLYQDSQRLYSDYYLSGANYWQMNSASFWGHNAIVRLEPFIANCALPKLPKLGALGGKILSHDTIESALIRRAGYSVKFSTDFIRSYEEYPPSWIELLDREQRWCQGNLQHFWFLGARELNFHSKVSILLGIFSYLSSVLWLLFIILSLFLYLDDLRFFRLAFNAKDFEIIFNEFYLDRAIRLQLLTLSLLFVPKIIAFLIDFLKPQRLILSRLKLFIFFLKENLISFLMAPTNMFQHVHFVFYTLIGKKVIWKNQKRKTDSPLSFQTAMLKFLYPFISGIILSIILLGLEFPLFIWFSPIWFSWIFSPFLAILTSYPLRKNDSSEFLNEIKDSDDITLRSVLTDPYFFGVHLFMVRERLLEKEKTKQALYKLCKKLLLFGPKSMTKKNIDRILNNKTALIHFHDLYWKTYPKDRASYWSDPPNKIKGSLLQVNHE